MQPVSMEPWQWSRSATVTYLPWAKRIVAERCFRKLRLMWVKYLYVSYLTNTDTFNQVRLKITTTNRTTQVDLQKLPKTERSKPLCGRPSGRLTEKGRLETRKRHRRRYKTDITFTNRSKRQIQTTSARISLAQRAKLLISDRLCAGILEMKIFFGLP